MIICFQGYLLKDISINIIDTQQVTYAISLVLIFKIP